MHTGSDQGEVETHGKTAYQNEHSDATGEVKLNRDTLILHVILTLRLTVFKIG